jgi:uncharacterized protein involved in exopolysaccharide biosynthesis
MSTVNRVQDDVTPVDLRDYLKILIEQKGFILAFCLSAILSSLFLTYFTSEKYEAATTIFYRPSETSLLQQKYAEAFGAPVPTPPFKVISQTLWNLVKSEVILRPVVERLSLDKRIEVHYETWYRRWYQETKDFIKEYGPKLWALLKYGRIIEEEEKVKAIKKLRDSIDLSPPKSKDSYIYILKAKDIYPERAAKIVDMAGEILVDWLKEKDHLPTEQRIRHLQEQMIEKEQEVRTLLDEWEDTLKGNQIVSISEETDSGVRNLYEMDREEAQLRAQIEKQQKRLAELGGKLQKRLQGYVDPDDYKKMQSEKLFEEIELKGLIKKRESLTISMSNLKRRLDRLPSLKNKVDDLDMKIKATIREYNHLKDFYVESLPQAMTIRSEIRVLHPAIIPNQPVQPIKIYHVGMTAILGILFSTGLAYVLAYLNVGTFLPPQETNGDQYSIFYFFICLG